MNGWFLVIDLSSMKRIYPKEIYPRKKLVDICCNRWAAAPSVRKPGSFLVALQVQWRNSEQQHNQSRRASGREIYHLFDIIVAIK